MIKKVPIIDVSGKRVIDAWKKNNTGWTKVMNAENAIKWEYQNHDEAVQVWFDNQNGNWLITHIYRSGPHWYKRNIMSVYTKEQALKGAEEFMKGRYP
jgi:hypothetical protein